MYIVLISHYLVCLGFVQPETLNEEGTCIFMLSAIIFYELKQYWRCCKAISAEIFFSSLYW